MITDEEIKQIAENYFGTFNCCGTLRPIDAIDINKFARAIYQLGRQHQRESDANEIMTMSQDCTRYEYVNAIWENTGDLK